MYTEAESLLVPPLPFLSALNILAPKDGVQQYPKFLRKPLQSQSSTETPHTSCPLWARREEAVSAEASHPSPHWQPHWLREREGRCNYEPPAANESSFQLCLCQNLFLSPQSEPKKRGSSDETSVRGDDDCQTLAVNNPQELRNYPSHILIPPLNIYLFFRWHCVGRRAAVLRTCVWVRTSSPESSIPDAVSDPAMKHNNSSWSKFGLGSTGTE